MPAPGSSQAAFQQVPAPRWPFPASRPLVCHSYCLASTSPCCFCSHLVLLREQSPDQHPFIPGHSPCSLLVPVFQMGLGVHLTSGPVCVLRNPGIQECLPKEWTNTQRRSRTKLPGLRVPLTQSATWRLCYAPRLRPWRCHSSNVIIEGDLPFTFPEPKAQASSGDQSVPSPSK